MSIRILTDKEHLEAKALAELGYTERAACVALGIDKPSVYIWSRKNKVNFSSQKTKKVQNDIHVSLHSYILDEVSKTIPPHMIGLELGISTEAIDFFAKQNNLETRKVNEEVLAKKLELIAACEKAKEVGEKINKSVIFEKIGIAKSTGFYAVRDNGFQEIARTRKEASIEDKAISIEEAQSRVVEGTVIGRNGDGYFRILTVDGHEYEKTISHLNQGDPRLHPHEITEEMMLVRVEAIRHKYVGGWFNINTRMTTTCPEGHVRNMSLVNLERGACSECTGHGTSLAEKTLKEKIEKLGFKTEKFKFSSGKTNKQEIDIYIPELKLGIEYCGLYWHSEVCKEKNNYHLDKMRKAENEGIELLTIFEDEYINREKQLFNLIRSKLGIIEKKIFARKCKITQPSRAFVCEFLEETHIQGKTGFEVSFGLEFEGRIVGVVCGSRHHRQGHGWDLILSRMSFLSGTQVIGGAGKLLSALTCYAKSKGYKSIRTWSDSRISQGKVYSKLGFKLQSKGKAEYSYVKFGKIERVPKQSFKKKRLVKMGGIGKTETEMAHSLKYFKIFDCGKKTWIMDI